MTYQKRVAAAGLAAVVALAGLAGCGGGQERAGATGGQVRELTAEEQALTELGFQPPGYEPGEPGDPDNSHRRGKGRFHNRHLAKRVLHGELVISTKDGPRTMVVQRGEITAVDGDSVTVKSSDGFSLTWTFGKKLRVLERRKTVHGDDLDVGEHVGIVGGEARSGAVARLILIVPKK